MLGLYNRKITNAVDITSAESCLALLRVHRRRSARFNGSILILKTLFPAEANDVCVSSESKYCLGLAYNEPCETDKLLLLSTCLLVVMCRARVVISTPVYYMLSCAACSLLCNHAFQMSSIICDAVHELDFACLQTSSFPIPHPQSRVFDEDVWQLWLSFLFVCVNN